MDMMRCVVVGEKNAKLAEAKKKNPKQNPKDKTATDKKQK